MLPDKRSQRSQFEILRFVITEENKLFSSFATFPQSVTKESFYSVKLILSDDWTLFNKNGLTLLLKRLLSVICFSFSFGK